MLLSMTGHGEFTHQSGPLTCMVEVRTVNNRHLKLVLRSEEALSVLESDIEKVVRETVKRGSIVISLKGRRQENPDSLSPKQSLFDLPLLKGYLTQAREAAGLDQSGEVLLAACLALPGVALRGSDSGSANLEEEWPVWETALRGALEKLQAMRSREGQAMARELISLQQSIQEEATAIAERAPEVVRNHREKLIYRLETAFAQAGLERKVEPQEILRECAMLAERLDISEEIVRLGSHLDQFVRFIEKDDSPGRKFDFLIQEMLRETNTIGSKASDLEIAHRVVEIKGLLERIRELVQNVE